MRNLDARVARLEAAGSAADDARGPSMESCVEQVAHLNAAFRRLVAYFRAIGAPAPHVARLEQLYEEWVPSRWVRDLLTAAEAEAQVAAAMEEARVAVADWAARVPCERRGNITNLAHESGKLARSFTPELEAIAQEGWTPRTATARELVASVCGPDFGDLGLPYPLGAQLLDVLRPSPDRPTYWDELREFSMSLAELDPHV